MVSDNEADYDYPVYFIYSHDKRNAALLAHSLQKSGLIIEKAKFRETGPTIGTHIAPAAYGIVYIRKQPAAE